MAPHNPDREPLDYSGDSGNDLYQPRNPSQSSNGVSKLARPLIDFVRNEWQTSAKYSLVTPSPDRFESPRWMHIVQSVVTAPRFRRYVLVYLGLSLSCWIGWRFGLSPRLEEQAAILKSLDPYTGADEWFGTNVLPQFEDVVQLRTLNSTLLPAPSQMPGTIEPSRRLIFIGDVHGCKLELERLLEEASFDQAHDHLIFAGDMINKGPDSSGVIDLARQYSASCVRGNHEDRILLLRHNMVVSDTLTNESADDSRDLKLARQLNDEQVKWLDACPVILDVGKIANMGQVVVVHAGLVPGVPLDRQDPYSVMNMLTIDLETHVPSTSRKGTKWTKLFNKHQTLLAASQPVSALDTDLGVTTVVYGHDSKTSLSLKEYTKGLDSGCVKGGKLTALVVSDGGAQQTVQVKCSKHKKEEFLHDNDLSDVLLGAFGHGPTVPVLLNTLLKASETK